MLKSYDRMHKRSVNGFEIFIASLVIFYGITGLSLRYLMTTKAEIFPFFAWNLFAHVPSTKIEYSIEITNYDGQQLDPPVPFRYSAHLGLSSGSVFERRITQELAQSYLRGSKEYEKQKLGLERYLGKTKEYLLVKETFDPIDFHNHKTIKKEVIASFKTYEYQK